MLQLLTGVGKLRVADATLRGLTEWVALFAEQKAEAIASQRTANRLAAFEATQKTNLGAAMSNLARVARARGIVVILSDLFDDEAAFESGLRQLRFNGHEVIVFHVLDSDELEFPFKGRVQFLGLEGMPDLITNPADIRKSYLAEMNAMRQRMRLACERTGSHYVLANTAHSLGETLSGYLVFRQQVGVR